jgi:hypothetical protein
MILGPFISTVPEIIGTLLRGVGAHDLTDGGADRFSRPCSSLAQKMLELGEYLFDRVQVGRVFRQQKKPCAGFADGVTNRGAVGEVVEIEVA